jgi:hypothetical protein
MTVVLRLKYSQDRHICVVDDLAAVFSRISEILSQDKAETVALSLRKVASLLEAEDCDQRLIYMPSLATAPTCMFCKPAVPSRLGLLNTPSHPTAGEIDCDGTASI